MAAHTLARTIICNYSYWKLVTQTRFLYLHVDLHAQLDCLGVQSSFECSIQ